MEKAAATEGATRAEAAAVFQQDLLVVLVVVVDVTLALVVQEPAVRVMREVPLEALVAAVEVVVLERLVEALRLLTVALAAMVLLLQ